MSHHYSNDVFQCEAAKDPNVIFAELDKGLHSSKIGEQCGAIVRYPQLFENYPFPIMIKSSFVKLANVFRSGTNFLRLCVFQVTQQCSQHLEKIGNVDDIVRCIHSVIHCNDPVARALTLRMLGSMSCIISEQKFVHHSILSSLDSHDKVEVVAALFAARSFAARSKSFSASVCTKLTEMIERLSVPVDMKLNFILICRNMNCDSETLEKVRTLCHSVLKRYPSCRFVLSALHTMTLLSKRSLVHLGDQVELLLEYLKEDVRSAVKRAVLLDLKLLASCAPHVWKSSHVHIIMDFLKTTSQKQLLLPALEVLSQLSSTIAVYLLAENLDSENSPMLECCHFACLHENPQISIEGIKMYVHVVSYEISLLTGAFIKDDEEKPAVLDDLCTFIEMKTMLAANGRSQEDLKILKESLLCTLKLCDVCPSVVVQFSQHAVFLLESSGDALKSISLCEFLSACHSKFSETPSMESSLEALLVREVNLLQTAVVVGPSEETLVLSIVRLLLQVRNKPKMGAADDGATREAKAAEEEEVDRAIVDGLKRVSPWTSFRVARQAARYGSHKLAARVFSGLKNLGRNEYHCFWMDGLSSYCSGEALLQVPPTNGNSRSTQVGNILKADDLLGNAIAAFKAATTSTTWFAFQTEYISLRSKTLRCLLQIIHACTSYQTIPPPAIASILADSTGLESHKVQHMLDQLKNCTRMLIDLQKGYHSLYYKCFDADSQTLGHISLLLDVCKLISQMLDSFFGITEKIEYKPSSMTEVGETLRQPESGESSMEWRQWETTKKDVLKVLKTMSSLNPTVIKFIEEVAILCSRRAICLPRFFFQKLQSTDIKLAVSPAMKSPDDPVLVKCDCEVVVKVEGIVNRVGKKRKAAAANVPGKIQLSLRSEHTPKNCTQAKVSNEFVEGCPIQGDYFCHKFLLSFSSPGIHQVSIDVSILDKSGNIWFTGTKSFLIFQAYDEALFRQQQLQQINAM